MSRNEIAGKPSIDDVSEAFGKATDAAWLRTRGWDFNALVDEYKHIEADFVARAVGSEVHVREIQRRITEIILQAALGQQQPFAICQQWWGHLGFLGFSDIERKCTMSWFYADGCLSYGQFDTGLAVLEPLIAELEASIADPTCTESAQRFYRQELETLCKIRDDLKAGIRE